MLVATVSLIFKRASDVDGETGDAVIDTIEGALNAFKDQVGADSAYLEDLYEIDKGEANDHDRKANH